MRNLPSIQQMMVFCKVIETGSFSIAAQKLGITPSAASKSVSQLEAQLGFLLLTRSTRILTLTQAGQFFFDHASAILFDMENLINEADGFRAQPQGRLQIASSMAFGDSQLVPLLGKFRQRYPQVDVHVELGDVSAIMQRADFELALYITDKPPHGYSTRKLTTIDWVYCAGTDYLAEHGIPDSLEDLRQHTCLVSSEHTWHYSRHGKQLRAQVRAALQANSHAILLQAALSNQGITYLPGYLAGQYIDNGQLEVLFSDYQANSNYCLYAMYHLSRYSNLKVRAFIDFLVDEIYPYPPWDRWKKNRLLSSAPLSQ